MGTKKVSPTLKVLVEIRDELRTTRSEMPSRNPMRAPDRRSGVHADHRWMGGDDGSFSR